MRRTAYIFWREYRSHLARRSYLLFTFGFPIFMVLTPVTVFILLALVVRSVMPATDPRPIAVVDEAGILADADRLPADPVEVLSLAAVEEAAGALAEGRIQAYYHIEADYWQSGAVTLTYQAAPSEAVRAMFANWLTGQVRARVTPEVLARLDRGPNIVHLDTAGAKAYSMADGMRAFMVFMLIYFVRMGGSFTAEYMFGSIAGEADHRTLEILLTSVSPLQFIIGKFTGLLAVGLTQLATWGGAALVLALAANNFLELNVLEPLLTWDYLGVMIAVFLAAYIMDQVLAATLGLLRVSGGAGNLLFGVINSIVGLALLYAAYFVPRNPHTPLAVATSIFPVTAPLVLLVRLVVAQVPAWQVALSLVCLWGTSLGSVLWLRWLLERNLVVARPAFSLRRWLKSRRRVSTGSR